MLFSVHHIQKEVVNYNTSAPRQPTGQIVVTYSSCKLPHFTKSPSRYLQIHTLNTLDTDDKLIIIQLVKKFPAFLECQCAVLCFKNPPLVLRTRSTSYHISIHFSITSYLCLAVPMWSLLLTSALELYMHIQFLHVHILAQKVKH